jgi:hypothetical protein
MSVSSHWPVVGGTALAAGLALLLYRSHVRLNAASAADSKSKALTASASSAAPAPSTAAATAGKTEEEEEKARAALYANTLYTKLTVEDVRSILAHYPSTDKKQAVDASDPKALARWPLPKPVPGSKAKALRRVAKVFFSFCNDCRECGVFL